MSKNDFYVGDVFKQITKYFESYFIVYEIDKTGNYITIVCFKILDPTYCNCDTYDKQIYIQKIKLDYISPNIEYCGNISASPEFYSIISKSILETVEYIKRIEKTYKEEKENEEKKLLRNKQDNRTFIFLHMANDVWDCKIPLKYLPDENGKINITTSDCWFYVNELENCLNKCWDENTDFCLTLSRNNLLYVDKSSIIGHIYKIDFDEGYVYAKIPKNTKYFDAFKSLIVNKVGIKAVFYLVGKRNENTKHFDIAHVLCMDLAYPDNIKQEEDKKVNKLEIVNRFRVDWNKNKEESVDNSVESVDNSVESNSFINNLNNLIK